MARGPRPLHPTVRQRSNVKTSRAELLVLDPADRAEVAVPEMPADRMWDPKTCDFWRDAWQSPMRLEWDPGDTHKLVIMAYALDEFYIVAGDPTMKPLDRAYAMAKHAKTLCDHASKLGLDPFARRSLDWLMVQTEKDEATRDDTRERTRQRRAPAAPATNRKKRGLGALG